MPGTYVRCDYCLKERDLETKFAGALTKDARDSGWIEVGNGPTFDRQHFCCDDHRAWFEAHQERAIDR